MPRKKDWRLSPVPVDRGTWFYCERRGVCVVRQIRDKDDKLVQGDMFYLPWRKLIEAVDNHRREQRAKSK